MITEPTILVLIANRTKQAAVRANLSPLGCRDLEAEEREEAQPSAEADTSAEASAAREPGNDFGAPAAIRGELRRPATSMPAITARPPGPRPDGCSSQFAASVVAPPRVTDAMA